MNISLSFCFLFLVGLANPGHSALLGGRFKQELGAARAEDLALYNTAANNAVQLMNDATKEANCNQNLLVFQKLVSVSTQVRFFLYLMICSCLYNIIMHQKCWLEPIPYRNGAQSGNSSRCVPPSAPFCYK